LKLLTIAFILLSTHLYAASITVMPFEMELDIQVGYGVRGEIELACRYEKIVWGDSAEYETFYQAPTKINISQDQNGDMKRITLKNTRKLFYEFDDFFKSGEECRASFKIVFFSEKYAMGYGVSPKKPVSFQLWKGFYDYQRGNIVFNLNKMRKYLDQTEYTFIEKRYLDSHINIWIKQDGTEADTTPWVAKAYIDPVTNLPYPPKL
jgi:hypothetical protein